MKKIIGFSFVICGLYSCKTSYIPNHVNSPMFREKGEARVNVSESNFQAAYAVTDHIGLMANGFVKTSTVTARDSGNSEDTYNKAKGNLFEGGVGYFTKLDETGWVFETYAGMGIGKLSFEDKVRENNTYQVRNYDANGMKFFLQPAIGYTSDYFDASFALRLTSLKFSGQTWSSNYSEDGLRDDKLYELHKPTWMFAEPTLTLRGGYKFIKAYVQFGYSYKMNSQPMNNKNDILGLGISLSYSPRFRN